MAGVQDFVEFLDDFFGCDTFATAGQGSPWAIADTSSSGTPTYAVVTPSASGEVALTLAATNEVENVCLSFGDKLCLDIDNLIEAEFRVKMSQAAVNAATSVAFGLASARNDAIDSITAHASFRVIGADSTTNLVVESDDGTTDKDDIATGTTLINAYKRFVISFANGTSDVRFFVDGVRVAASTTFNMSAYTSSVQPYIQIQKTADTNTDGVAIDYVRILSRRA